MNKILKYILILILFNAIFAVEAAERIVVTFPQSFGIIYIMQLSDKIVGIPTQKLNLKKGQLGSFFSYYSPNIASATDIGFTGAVNIETVMSLHPDLIISSANYSTSRDNTKFFRENGIKVLELKAGSGSVEEWLEVLNKACNEVGVPERSLAYTKIWEKNLNLVNERLNNIPKEKRVKVTLINSNGGEIAVRGSKSKFCINLIKLAGGIVMEGDEDPKDSAACAELVFKFDPDVIIDDYSTTKNVPEWIQHLRAVKEGRVYSIPYDDKENWLTIWTFNTYSPLGLLWLAKSFYPNEFVDIDLDKAQNEFCNTVFGSNFKKLNKDKTTIEH